MQRQRKRRKLEEGRATEGRGRDEELLLLSGGLKKKEGCVHYRRHCSPGAAGDEAVTVNHLCTGVYVGNMHTHTHT